MNKNLKNLFFMGLLISGIFFSTSFYTHSMCVYNKTDTITFDARFDCGIFCQNTWKDILVDERKCRPDKGGLLIACTDESDNFSSCDKKCATNLTPHEWVDVVFDELLICEVKEP